MNIIKRIGAEEACWAHNPEVLGSKPRSATISKTKYTYIILLYNGCDDIYLFLFEVFVLFLEYLFLNVFCFFPPVE